MAVLGSTVAQLLLAAAMSGALVSCTAIYEINIGSDRCVELGLAR